uniref:Transmembrane protein n=1 Tax=Mycena chlorophos TaxID=658473 RepID=A0ABQ0LCR8_MYCCL|nr:predicted protein [Mycena chlorophos]
MTSPRYLLPKPKLAPMAKTLPPFLEDIFFASHVRVYTFRALLLASIVNFPLVLLLVGSDLDTQIIWPIASWVLLMVGTGLSIIHQIITSLMLKPNSLQAILDMIFLLLEITVMIVGLALFGASSEGQSMIPVWLISSVAVIIGLSFSFILRLAAILRGHGYGLLGGCRPTTLPYNRKSIFLNRSIQRPLVRGESMLIRLIRAFCISGIALLVPAFGIYAIILVPSKQQTYLKLQVDTIDSFSFSQLGLSGDSLLANATFWIAPFSISGGPSQFLVNWTATISYPSDVQPETSVCVGTNMTIPGLLTLCSGSMGWGGLMSLKISLPSALSGVTVTPMPWSDVVGYTTPSMGYIWSDGSFTVANFATPSPPVLVLQSSYLCGQMLWSREMSLTPSMGSLYTPSISNLQHDTTTTPSINSSNSAALRIFCPTGPGFSSGAYYQQINDRSTISGFSDLGGFWTFVDSTFALLFGANVIYFAFGHRPLSALGVLHLFQRKTLTRNWNEDFPALHTEGGLPGTDSAGIVAFIRERLVDVGKAPTTPTPSPDPPLPLSEEHKPNEETHKVQSVKPVGESTESMALKPLRGRDFLCYDSAV